MHGTRPRLGDGRAGGRSGRRRRVRVAARRAGAAVPAAAAVRACRIPVPRLRRPSGAARPAPAGWRRTAPRTASRRKSPVLASRGVGAGAGAARSAGAARAVGAGRARPASRRRGRLGHRRRPPALARGHRDPVGVGGLLAGDEGDDHRHRVLAGEVRPGRVVERPRVPLDVLAAVPRRGAVDVLAEDQELAPLLDPSAARGVTSSIAAAGTERAARPGLVGGVAVEAGPAARAARSRSWTPRAPVRRRQSPRRPASIPAAPATPSSHASCHGSSSNCGTGGPGPRRGPHFGSPRVRTGLPPSVRNRTA